MIARTGLIALRRWWPQPFFGTLTAMFGLLVLRYSPSQSGPALLRSAGPPRR
jgi:hypothetical protein